MAVARVAGSDPQADPAEDVAQGTEHAPHDQVRAHGAAMGTLQMAAGEKTGTADHLRRGLPGSLTPGVAAPRSQASASAEAAAAVRQVHAYQPYRASAAAAETDPVEAAIIRAGLQGRGPLAFASTLAAGAGASRTDCHVASRVAADQAPNHLTLARRRDACGSAVACSPPG